MAGQTGIPVLWRLGQARPSTLKGRKGGKEGVGRDVVRGEKRKHTTNQT